MKTALQIIFGTILLAILYGIAHDLVTAHVAVEYFTEEHPRFIDSESPIAMAFLWGFLATWWFGLAAGVLFAWVNWRTGGWLTAGQILWIVAKSLVLVYATAMAVLASAYLVADVIPLDILVDDYSRAQRVGVVALTHNYSYLACLFAAVCIALLVRQRALSESARSEAAQI